jgi:hypothetical protein
LRSHRTVFTVGNVARKLSDSQGDDYEHRINLLNAEIAEGNKITKQLSQQLDKEKERTAKLGNDLNE